MAGRPAVDKQGHESRPAAEMIYSSDLLIFRQHSLEEVLNRHRFGQACDF